MIRNSKGSSPTYFLDGVPLCSIASQLVAKIIVSRNRSLVEGGGR